MWDLGVFPGCIMVLKKELKHKGTRDQHFGEPHNPLVHKQAQFLDI